MSCPVSFCDAADPVVRESGNAGILVLLGVTIGVLGGFARFVLSLARRSREVGKGGRESLFESVLEK